jgi:hypothetical protein
MNSSIQKRTSHDRERAKSRAPGDSDITRGIVAMHTRKSTENRLNHGEDAGRKSTPEYEASE